MPRQEHGAIATEYGLIVLFIATVVAAGIAAFGGAIEGYLVSLTATLSGVL